MHGPVAQQVEQRTENPCRASSILAFSTRWGAVTHGAELQRTDRGATGRIQIRQSAPKQLRVGFGIYKTTYFRRTQQLYS